VERCDATGLSANPWFTLSFRGNALSIADVRSFIKGRSSLSPRLVSLVRGANQPPTHLATQPLTVYK
jgi:hypothetical protein